LFLEILTRAAHIDIDPGARKHWKEWGAVAICTLTTLYFFRQNLRGIHESSDKALKIMIVTTIMGAIMLAWCGLTLAVQGPAKYEVVDEKPGKGTGEYRQNQVPLKPDLEKKPKYSVGANPDTGKFEEKEDPLGFISDTKAGEQLRAQSKEGGPNWLG